MHPINTAYWTCSGCGKYFSNANGTTEIAKDSWIIPKTGHSYKTSVTPATMKADGKITVSSKGVVTVPKKCKAGTYTISVKAAGNDNYKPVTKTVTIKVINK